MDRRCDRTRIRPSAALLGVLMLVVLLVANVLLSCLPNRLTKFDMTGLGMTEISVDTEKFLRAMKEDVTVTWLCEGGVTDPQLSLLLTRYEEAGAYIQVEVVDPLTHPTYSSDYRRGSMSNYSLVVASARRATLIDASELNFYTNGYIDSLYQQEMRMTAEEFQYYYTYAGEQMAAYESRAWFNGEALLTAALDYVTRETIPHAYLLTGLGNDNALSATMQGLLAAMGTTAEALDMTTATAIPEDADCLLLPDPKTDLSDAAATLVEAYLARGGSLMLTTAPTSLSACPNILRLCATFGLTATEGLVVEGDLEAVPGTSTDVFIPKGNTNHVVVQYMNSSGYELYMPRAHAITISEDLPAGVSAVGMFTTSEKAKVVEPGNVSNTIGETGTYTVGVSAQKTVSLPDGTATVASLTWWGSGEVLTDKMAEQTEGGNYYYYATVVRYMSPGFSSPYEALSPVPVTSAGLSGLSDATFFVLAALVAVIVPAGFVAIGIAVWIRRKRR